MTIDRAVEVSGDTGDRLKPDGIQMEELGYGVFHNCDLGAGIDHHARGDRFPCRAFFRQELDVGGMRRE
jgi:hypothetical protein